MTKIYIANCTQQDQDFQYRLPGNNQAFMLKIPLGNQRALPLDLTAPQIQAIIEQHARYGLVHVSEIDRTRPFAGLCWQEDKPVPIPAITKLLHHNYEVLTERGERIREEMAIAVTSQVQDALDDLSRRADRPHDLKEFSVQVQEEAKAGEDRNVDTTVIVPKTAPAGRKAVKGKGPAPIGANRRG